MLRPGIPIGVLTALAVVTVILLIYGGLSRGVGASPSGATSVGGLISTDTTWSSGDSPIIVTSSILVQQGVTLTIEPGVEVRFNEDLFLQVNGELIARGTDSAPIVFTSNESEPAPSDWGYVLFTDSSVDATFNGSGDYVSGSILEYCTVAFAGASNNYALGIDSSGPFINQCTIKDNSGSGISAVSGSVKISKSAITGSIASEDGGSGISISGGIATLSGNTVSGNASGKFGGGISISAAIATLSANTISGNTSVYGGGVYIEESEAVNLSNNLIMGNRASDHGGGVFIGNGSVALSGNTIISNTAWGSAGGIYLGGAVALSRSIIAGNTASGEGGGIFIGQGNFTLSGNTIAGNAAGSHGSGLASTSSSATFTLLDNTIAANISIGASSSVIFWEGSTESAFGSNNLFENDAQYLVYNALPNTAPDANMENNWWGTTNTADIAASIYDLFDDISKGIVDYIPFLNQPNTGAPVSPPMGLVATGDPNTMSIALSWTPNPEADIAGYKVYYKTGDSGFPYLGAGAASGDSPIDVGNATSFTLSGLAQWAKYYIVVTAYDSGYDPAGDDPGTIVNENQTNGNESWYSAEVVAGANVDTALPY